MNLPIGTKAPHQDRSEELSQVLADFGVIAKVEQVISGFSITTYKLRLGGGKSFKIVAGLGEDLAMNLGVKSVTVCRQGSFVAIEVPNEKKGTLCMGDIFAESDAELPMFLGMDTANRPIIHDLAQAPHLLIGGKTGSGKSVGIHAIITSLALSKSPEDVGMIMVDPKKVELGMYNSLAHLIRPIIDEPAEATAMLGELCTEMDSRYEILAASKSRNIIEHRSKGGKMRYIVIIIDELADLMMTASKETELHISRLTAKARAAGIHLVVATQRPEVKVVSGLIKANIPGRISYATTTGIDSKIILDEQGAENLLGKGDMLVHVGGDTVRGQGVFIGQDVIDAAVSRWGKMQPVAVKAKAVKKDNAPTLLDSVAHGFFDMCARKAGLRKGRKSQAEKTLERFF